MRATTRVWALAAFLTATLAGAQPARQVEIAITEAGPGVWMLKGRGGNLAVSIGDDGAILVDDDYAPLTEKILAAVASLGGERIRFVINTHWHSDHTGGNEGLGERGALIVAHDNVRERLSTEQFLATFDATYPPSPEAALPVVTFTDAVTLHFNGEQIHAFHPPAAHTDGDAVIHFRSADVIHTGDLVFYGIYPFIDTSSGGSIDGVIAGVRRILAMAGPETRIIPGHGPLIGPAELATYLEMLEVTRARVARLKAAGMSLEEVAAAAPTAEFDEDWGDGFLRPEQFVGFLYETLP